MSDEETDNEATGFTVHKLSWRSNLLNRLLVQLDKHYNENRKKSTLRTKPRETGEYSVRCKPFGAPKWTYQEQSSSTELPVSGQPPTPTESPITVLQPSPSSGALGQPLSSTESPITVLQPSPSSRALGTS